MRKRESSRPNAYADIHRAGRGLREVREGRPAFARSIGTRANLQARSPFDVSDQALAFAMTSGARGAGLKQQIASQLSGSRRKHDQESAPVESAALNGSLLLSLAGAVEGFNGAVQAASASRSPQERPAPERQAKEAAQSPFQCAEVHSMKSQDSLDDIVASHLMTQDSLSPTLQTASPPAEAMPRQDAREAAIQRHESAVQQILHGHGGSSPPATSASGTDTFQGGLLAPTPAHHLGTSWGSWQLGQQQSQAQTERGFVGHAPGRLAGPRRSSMEELVDMTQDSLAGNAAAARSHVHMLCKQCTRACACACVRARGCMCMTCVTWHAQAMAWTMW